MITKINAEMDSIETAELAARMIKQKTDGIISIKIDRKNQIDTNDDYNLDVPFYPFATQNGTANNGMAIGDIYTGGYLNLNERNHYNDQREISRAVIIDVICEKQAENVVTQTFTSLGGLKINKN